MENHTNSLPTTLQLPPQDFATEISWFLNRHITILPRNKPKSILPINQHQSIHPTITTLLVTTFQLTHSYYLSPLIYPLLLKRYNSPHTRDVIFSYTILKMERRKLCTPSKSSHNNIIHTLGQNGSQRKP
jgi:hypothetical protein